VTRIRVRRSGGSNPSRGEKCFSSPNRPDRLWSQPSLLFNGFPLSFSEVRRTGCEAELSPPSSTEVEWKLHGVARDKSVFLNKPTNISLEKNILYNPLRLAGTPYISVVRHIYSKS
jgi:hypothetical protein